MRQMLVISRAALIEAHSNRRAFYTKVSLMAVNDCVWAMFFVLLMARAGSIRGWDIDDILLLNAFVTTAIGVGLGLAGNCRRLGQIIEEGGLDSTLTLPVSPLKLLLLRRAEPSAIGDGVFGVGVFLLFCDPTPQRVALFFLGALLAATVIVSFLTLLGCIAFFVRGSHQHSDFVFNGMLGFAMYPVDLFGGVTKFFLFSVLPVAFIGTVPAGLVRDFDPVMLAVLASFALGLAAVARLAFDAGLKRYRSGALWTHA